MSDGSSGATALLGMDGFVVLAMIEQDGELFISVETTANVVGCGSCGVRAVGHGRSVTQIRDLPSGGRPVRMVWRKRKWICRDPDCAAKSFTEQSDLVEDS
jgi:transposase